MKVKIVARGLTLQKKDPGGNYVTCFEKSVLSKRLFLNNTRKSILRNAGVIISLQDDGIVYKEKNGFLYSLKIV